MIGRVASRALVAAGIVLGIVWNAAASEPPFELAVKKDRLFGSSAGTLVFDAEGIEYRTREQADTRKWSYPDVKQVQILSPTRIALLTYEDQGRLKLGADRTYRYEVANGTVPPELVAFLLDQVRQPVVTAVMPPFSRWQPLYCMPVKYERRTRGSDGTLVLSGDALVFLSETKEHARYWRAADIFAVLQIDRSRLEVLAYEGGGGNTRRFTFQIKSELPEGFYQALWTRVNSPARADRAAVPRLASER